MYECTHTTRGLEETQPGQRKAKVYWWHTHLPGPADSLSCLGHLPPSFQTPSGHSAASPVRRHKEFDTKQNKMLNAEQDLPIEYFLLF
jgi:hypothetical protein